MPRSDSFDRLRGRAYDEYSDTESHVSIYNTWTPRKPHPKREELLKAQRAQQQKNRVETQRQLEAEKLARRKELEEKQRVLTEKQRQQHEEQEARKRIEQHDQLLESKQKALAEKQRLAAERQRALEAKQRLEQYEKMIAYQEQERKRQELKQLEKIRNRRNHVRSRTIGTIPTIDPERQRTIAERWARINQISNNYDKQLIMPKYQKSIY